MTTSKEGVIMLILQLRWPDSGSTFFGFFTGYP